MSWVELGPRGGKSKLMDPRSVVEFSLLDRGHMPIRGKGGGMGWADVQITAIDRVNGILTWTAVAVASQAFAPDVPPGLAVAAVTLTAIVAVGWIVDRRNRLARERADAAAAPAWFVEMACQVWAALVAWVRADRRRLLPMKAGGA